MRIRPADDDEYKRYCLTASPLPELPLGIVFADQQVTLQAIIGKDGTIQELAPIAGDSALFEAAMDSVRQHWTLRPLQLNGKPVEVVTQLQVRFAPHSG